jgi:AbrB family looped-hinge helix DNA binding protein
MWRHLRLRVKENREYPFLFVVYIFQISDILNLENCRGDSMRVSTVYKTEIRQRGQVTIPKSVREASGLDEGCSVTLIPVGESILIAPQRLGLDEARRIIAQTIRATGMTLDEVMADLVSQRQPLFEELNAKRS